MFRLRAAGGGRLAVERASAFSPADGPGTGDVTTSGEVRTLAADGRALAVVRPAGEHLPEIALGRTLVLLRGFSLEVRDARTGRLLRTLQLGPAARLSLVGTSSTFALLAEKSRLVLVRLRDGARRDVPLPAAVRKCACPISPRIGDAGLVYGYNLASGPERGRVVFVPHAALLARFG